MTIGRTEGAIDVITGNSKVPPCHGPHYHTTTGRAHRKLFCGTSTAIQQKVLGEPASKPVTNQHCHRGS